jgi:hypothetical protein
MTCSYSHVRGISERSMQSSYVGRTSKISNGTSNVFGTSKTASKQWYVRGTENVTTSTHGRRRPPRSQNVDNDNDGCGFTKIRYNTRARFFRRLKSTENFTMGGRSKAFRLLLMLEGRKTTYRCRMCGFVLALNNFVTPSAIADILKVYVDDFMFLPASREHRWLRCGRDLIC